MPVIRLFLIACLVAAVSGCVIKVGPSGAARQSSSGALRNVDGNLRIGDGATVKSANTVDGNVFIGANVYIGAIDVIDGDLRARRDLIVRRDIDVIDGDIVLVEGARVDGSIKLVDGFADLVDVGVGGDIDLRCADAEMLRVQVRGRLRVRGDAPGNDCGRPLRVRIGPGSEIAVLDVDGDVHLDVADDAVVREDRTDY